MAKLKEDDNQPQIILFDIDRTLFDTSVFAGLIRQKISILAQVSSDTLIRLENEYINSLSSRSKFSPSSFCGFLERELNIPSIFLMQEFIYDKTTYIDSLFADVLPVLKKLKEKGISLGVFSEGELAFQRLKVDYSGIGQYLDKNHIYIFEEKLSSRNLKEIPVGSLIIDNSETVVNFLRSRGFNSIWINRNPDMGLILNPNISSLFSLLDLSDETAMTNSNLLSLLSILFKFI